MEEDAFWNQIIQAIGVLSGGGILLDRLQMRSFFSKVTMQIEKSTYGVCTAHEFIPYPYIASGPAVAIHYALSKIGNSPVAPKWRSELCSAMYRSCAYHVMCTHDQLLQCLMRFRQSRLLEEWGIESAEHHIDLVSRDKTVRFYPCRWLTSVFRLDVENHDTIVSVIYHNGDSYYFISHGDGDLNLEKFKKMPLKTIKQIRHSTNE